MKEIDKYMSVAEAADRWGIPLETVKAKLKSREQSYVKKANEMIEQGLIKYYLKPGGIRKEWIISEMAMVRWFGEKKGVK